MNLLSAGHANLDGRPDLICFRNDGGVSVAQATEAETADVEFIADSWKNDEFDFCTGNAGEVSKKLKLNKRDYNNNVRNKLSRPVSPKLAYFTFAING